MQPEMVLSPLALSILGMDTVNNRRRPRQGDEAQEATQNRVARPSRRATSYYNSFPTICSSATDSAPAYADAAKQKLPQPHPDFRREQLPGYTCSVSTEAKLLLQLESMNPLHGVSESEWKDTYIVLRGTLLNFYRVKDGGCGKLLRSYTLQHAEIGLALDTQHTVLIPQSRLAHLIPLSQRKRAWQKDPGLFKPVRQTIMRLRLETDQLLLADASEDRLHELISAISAGIDIAHAIDERSIPRQCTVPRRRRRQRATFSGDLNDPALLAEQQRILGDMYPAFAERSDQTTNELGRTNTEDTTSEPAQTSAREEDDLDLAIIREDFAVPHSPTVAQHDDTAIRPEISRQTTASTIGSTHSSTMVYATSPHNFTSSGKWQPPHTRTEGQVIRYARRCMPVLLAEAVRASDVLICNGKRVKINWRMELLEEWELQPPSYKSHAFGKGEGLQRSKSSSSATQTTPQSSRSMGGPDADQIEPVESGLANLDLSKVMSVTAEDKGSPTRTSASCEQEVVKVREVRRPGAEVHGVVFCF